MNNKRGNAGVIAKIFGAIMIILGSMDCMLAWRGSFQVNSFFLVLIILGLVLFCFGAIRASSSEGVR